MKLKRTAINLSILDFKSLGPANVYSRKFSINLSILDFKTVQVRIRIKRVGL